eukprot:ANDGO_02117.mRNA.1 Signal peptide peptidase 2
MDAESMLPTYGTILALAVLPIVYGSIRSVQSPSTQAAMSHRDATMFPFIASGALFGLFLAFKFLPKEYVNMILSGYFLFLGAFALRETILPFLVQLSPRTFQSPVNAAFVFKYKTWIDIEFSMQDVYSLIPGLMVVVWYGFTKHWIANNILGLAFSVSAIALMSCGSFRIGCVLLWGLFVYDVFWVFGTPVMVSVATQFDAPIKLVIPRASGGFSMLGLGDIVLPGVLCALMLRFDHARLQPSRKTAGVLGSQHVYFNTIVLFYIVGLATTIAVMHLFQAAQPALLYLVPACTGSVALLAIIRGEWKQLMAYSESSEQGSDAAAAAVSSPKSDSSSTPIAAAGSSSNLAVAGIPERQTSPRRENDRNKTH